MKTTVVLLAVLGLWITKRRTIAKWSRPNTGRIIAGRTGPNAGRPRACGVKPYGVRAARTRSQPQGKRAQRKPQQKGRVPGNQADKPVHDIAPTYLARRTKKTLWTCSRLISHALRPPYRGCRDLRQCRSTWPNHCAGSQPADSLHARRSF